MKKIIIYFIIAVFMFSGISFAGQKGKRDQGRKQQNQHYKQKNKHRQPRHYGEGYRYQYHGKRKHHPRHYRGHWRSWRAWEDYHRHNRHRYKSHRYYRDKGGSLYFEFETEEGRFAFSIGR